jgi:hypothetical protein
MLHLRLAATGDASDAASGGTKGASQPLLLTPPGIQRGSSEPCRKTDISICDCRSAASLQSFAQDI